MQYPSRRTEKSLFYASRTSSEDTVDISACCFFKEGCRPNGEIEGDKGEKSLKELACQR